MSYDLPCPACAAPNSEIRGKRLTVPFTYGVAPASVELSATYPVYTCKQCKSEFCDEAADRFIEQAIINHKQNLLYWQTHQFCDHLQLADLIVAQSALRKHWAPRPKGELGSKSRGNAVATALLISAAMLPRS